MFCIFLSDQNFGFGFRSKWVFSQFNACWNPEGFLKINLKYFHKNITIPSRVNEGADGVESSWRTKLSFEIWINFSWLNKPFKDYFIFLRKLFVLERMQCA